jgi:alkanesulfonate monooxygenase SsuD/methylene tetrahydromethanopterin reductase-like flavin-dependent oxidoreductase (luciferase family)
MWIPVTSSKESIEFAGRNNFPITPGAGSRGLREDIIRHYARCLTQAGHSITPDHLIIQANAYIADSKEQAVAEAGPHALYFNRTLFSHGNDTEADRQRASGYLSSGSFDYVRPENMGAVARAREDYRDMTIDQVKAMAERLPWGRPDEAIEKIIAEADHHGSNTVVVSLNRGVMPAEMFMQQVRRFGAEVLPALQAHEVKEVPLE